MPPTSTSACPRSTSPTATTGCCARHAGAWRPARSPPASNLYLAASRAAPAEWSAREDTLRALEVLTSANRGKESLQAADDALGRWPTDRRLLDRGITLARAQGDGARAKRWSERLVALGPEDDAILRRHLDIELGEGDVATAFTVATRLVARHPEDAALRRKLADTATWSGHPEEALAAWAWLGSRGSGEAEKRTLALGHDLFNYDRVSEVLERRAADGTITIDELLDLSDALESSGAPERADAVLRRLEPVFGATRAYWTERAEVAEHRQDLEDALLAVGQIADALRPARRGRGARGRALVVARPRRRRAGGGAARGADDDRRRDQLLAAVR